MPPNAARVKLVLSSEAKRLLAPEDLTRLNAVANGDYSLLHKLSGTRSGIVKLTKPIEVGGRTFYAVKLKGCLDATSGEPVFPSAKRYLGEGRNLLKNIVKPDGDCGQALEEELPQGPLLYHRALTEIGFTQHAFRDGEPVNYVLGHGIFKDLKFETTKGEKKKLAFALIAIEDPEDARLHGQLDERDAKEVQRVMELFGRTLRKFNEKRFHVSPAIWNFSLSADGKRVVIHDLDASKLRAGLTPKQAAMQQTIEVTQALHYINKTIHPDIRGKQEFNVFRFFLKGYFHDFTPQLVKERGLSADNYDRVTGFLERAADDLFLLRHTPEELAEARTGYPKTADFDIDAQNPIELINSAILNRDSVAQTISSLVHVLPENKDAFREVIAEARNRRKRG